MGMARGAVPFPLAMKTSIKPYSQRELDAERRELAEVHQTHGTSAKVGESGRLTMNIPPKAYFNAIARNGGVIGGKTVWSDREFRRDMLKRHPELGVKPADSGSRVGPLRSIGPKTSDLFRGKYDDVPDDPEAKSFIETQAELLRR